MPNRFSIYHRKQAGGQGSAYQCMRARTAARVFESSLSFMQIDFAHPRNRCSACLSSFSQLWAPVESDRSAAFCVCDLEIRTAESTSAHGRHIPTCSDGPLTRSALPTQSPARISLIFHEQHFVSTPSLAGIRPVAASRAPHSS